AQAPADPHCRAPPGGDRRVRRQQLLHRTAASRGHARAAGPHRGGRRRALRPQRVGAQRGVAGAPAVRGRIRLRAAAEWEHLHADPRGHPHAQHPPGAAAQHAGVRPHRGSVAQPRVVCGQRRGAGAGRGVHLSHAPVRGPVRRVLQLRQAAGAEPGPRGGDGAPVRGGERQLRRRAADGRL
ncbi:MAG: hypothetical protein AVDCRST_MAG68-324, partial [uncultured Gemmatimonadetes bacterium]